MKVFLSSTYDDLVEYRKSVDGIINRMAHEYRGMEYFGSRSSEPQKVCFEEIKKSDIFIGVYAHRYGCIPKDSTKSITEQEFDYAKELGLTILCYVVDENQPWIPKFIDKEDRKNRLSLFKNKVKDFVITTFTEPDDLAKKVAADIGRQRSETKKINFDLRPKLSNFCAREIENTIGPKYIRELHVNRSVESQFLKENQIFNLNKKLRDKFIAEAIDAFAKTEQKINELRSKNKSKILSMVKECKKRINDFKTATNLDLIKSTLPFPSEKILTPIKDVKNCLDGIQVELSKQAKRKIPKEEKEIFRSNQSKRRIEEIDDLVEILMETGRQIEVKLRPISLILDRAGGGKTNVLCKVTEELTDIVPTFFVAAKSIPHATEEGILAYLSSTYQIGDDPIETALNSIGENYNHIVFILDGINEHFEPKKFNAAFKSFVKRYYEKPIRYIVSCRDIYWAFFEDDWWRTHCRVISRGELYDFKASEFKSALPKYMNAYYIKVRPVQKAKKQLHHPLLLRFFCEAYKGTKNAPSNMGTIRDIRLLGLFDAYCERKYKQIQEKLILASPADVSGFVEMLGKLMLQNHSRFVPIEQVRQKSMENFGEPHLHQPESRYVNILDEDIIIEQTMSSKMNYKVEFVYDEFMEYIIANAVLAEAYDSVKMLNLKKVFRISKRLLLQEEKFISIVGILIFIGEIVARASLKDGLLYIDWLVEKARPELACRVLSRWPEETLSEEILSRLLHFHSDCHTQEIRTQAWKSMEEIYWIDWSMLFEYFKGMEMTGLFRPNRVFSFLKRAEGGTNPTERLETISWIRDKMAELKATILLAEEGPDVQSGLSAIQYLVDKNKKDWDYQQRQTAEGILQESIDMAKRLRSNV